jgi:methionine aminopeptidase
MLVVGQVDEEGWRLVEGARKALDEAVKRCRPGGCLSDIGEAVQVCINELIEDYTCL